MFSSLFRADGGDDRSVFGDFWFEPVTFRSASGVRVSPDQAMRLSTVYRCVRVLSGTMASLPLCFYRPKADGRGRERVTDHPLYRLLAKKPNRWQSSFEWHSMMQGHISLRGTGYNRIVPKANGEIAELVPMHPDRMKVELLDSGVYRYIYTKPNGDKEVLPAGSVFKIAPFSSNGFTGINPMELASDSVGEGLAQQSYSSRFFANDARPLGGWIEMATGQKFKDPEAKQGFSDSWQRAQAGVNRGKTAVLEGGMKYHEIGVNNKDAQMLEAKNAKVADICRWFGVPPHLAFALDRATDNNIERLSLEFIKFTMRELAECWEAAIGDQLLDPDENIEPEYDMDKLARGEMKSRAEYYQLGINAGWLTPNEARDMEGLNPLDELDEPLRPLNMVPAGTEPVPKPADKSAPAPEQTEDGEDQARARALELAIAGRVVRKETTAALHALKRHLHQPDAFRKWATDFYGTHVDYVVDSLLCATEVAAAWCDRQLDELMAAVDQEVAGVAVIQPLLEAWETTAAAELAARVQTSALPARSD